MGIFRWFKKSTPSQSGARAEVEATWQHLGVQDFDPDLFLDFYTPEVCERLLALAEQGYPPPGKPKLITQHELSFAMHLNMAWRAHWRRLSDETRAAVWERGLTDPTADSPMIVPVRTPSNLLDWPDPLRFVQRCEEDLGYRPIFMLDEDDDEE